MPTRKSAISIMAVLTQRELIGEAVCEARRVQLVAQLNALKSGDATDDSFDQLANATNIAAFRTADGDFPEAIPAIGDAQNALHAIRDRAIALRKWIARGEEIRALETFIPIYIAMMGASTQLEMRKATLRAYPDLKRTNMKRKAA